eukprot:3078118-Rhodomonas_salina.1
MELHDVQYSTRVWSYASCGTELGYGGAGVGHGAIDFARGDGAHRERPAERRHVLVWLARNRALSRASVLSRARNGVMSWFG